MARDKGRSLATSSLTVGRFTAKKGSLRSPRSRLVASLASVSNLKTCFIFIIAFAGLMRCDKVIRINRSHISIFF